MKIVKYNSGSNNGTVSTSTSSAQYTGYYGTTPITSTTTTSLLDLHYLWGQPFNGTQDVSGDLTGVDNIDAEGMIEASGLTVETLSSQTGTIDSLSGDSLTYKKGNIKGLSGDTLYYDDIKGKNISGQTIRADESYTNYGHFTGLTSTTIDTGNITALSGYIKSLLSDEIVVDNLTVTKAAHFFKLIIDELKSVGGSVILTAANARFDKVEQLSNGNYRCYFRSKDADNRQIDNQFEVNDQVVCQTFNATTGTSYDVSNKFYWRLCVGVDSSVVTTNIDGQDVECHYIDLSSTDYDTSSNGVPSANDEVAQLGNRSDSERQNAIIISAYQNVDKEVKAPSFAQYKGINNYSISQFRKTTISPNNNYFTGRLIVTSDDDTINNKSIDDLINENAVSSVTDYYMLTTASTNVTTATTGWSTTQQKPTKAKPYLWKYTKTVYRSGKVSNSPTFILDYYDESTNYFEIDFSRKVLEVAFKDGNTTYSNGCLQADIRGTVNYIHGESSTPTANKTVKFSFYTDSGTFVQSASTTSNSSGAFTYANNKLQNPYHTATNKIGYCKVEIP